MIDEATTKGRNVHFCLTDGHLSSEECRIGDKAPKIQRSSCYFRGDIVKDDSGSYAVFTEQGSSASQMTAAKVMDIISRLPGCAGQAADAVSAYTQVKMEVAIVLVHESGKQPSDDKKLEFLSFFTVRPFVIFSDRTSFGWPGEKLPDNRRCIQNTHSNDTFVHVQRITERTTQMFSLTQHAWLKSFALVRQKVVSHPSVMSHMLPHLPHTTTRSLFFRPSSPSLSWSMKPCETHGGVAETLCISHSEQESMCA